MGTAYVSATCSVGTNKATVTWDSDYEVTVNVTSGSLSWRVRGRASDGDSKVYCSGTGQTSDSFAGTKGKTYIFQVYDTVEETYANSGTTGGNNASDTSDFILSDSGDSGGDETTSYFVYISVGKGTNIDVRDKSGNPIKHLGTVESGAYIAIACTAIDGYTLTSFKVEGATHRPEFDSDGYEIYKVTGNVLISATAEPNGRVYIDNGTTLEAYQIFIDNGSSWDQYIPYIDNGSGWDMYN